MLIFIQSHVEANLVPLIICLQFVVSGNPKNNYYIVYKVFYHIFHVHTNFYI